MKDWKELFLKALGGLLMFLMTFLLYSIDKKIGSIETTLIGHSERISALEAIHGKPNLKDVSKTLD